MAMRCVATLPIEDQTLLALRIGQGLSWGEIATILAADGKPLDENTVTKRFSRLKEKISRMLQEQGLSK